MTPGCTRGQRPRRGGQEAVRVSVEPVPERRVPAPRPRNGAAAEAGRRPVRPTPESTFFSRYECKYLVDPRVVPQIREFLRSFTEPDEFAALREGYRYPICSLYLDSPELKLYLQTVGGEKDRFKLRVRTYSDDPDAPAFFEVKRKLNAIVHKRRAGLDREKALRLLSEHRLDPGGLGTSDHQDAEYFRNHVEFVAARPVVRVKYLREAYQGLDNEPVRITLDTDLMHAVTFDHDLSHERGRWVSTPLDGVIVEIKFTERYPWWVQELVRAFGLTQRAVPKYVMSIDHMMMDGRESAFALAGLTLPPIRRT
jgi:hypothetical protein